jgi:hypothetical protein
MTSPRSIAAFALLVVLGSLGSACSPMRRASLVKTAAHHAAPRDLDHVEVLLDREPDKPFRVVGVLEVTSLESPQSIDLMRDEAARAGLDGIYWIECANPRSGKCTAKGYVYDDHKTAPSNEVIARAPATTPKAPESGGISLATE